MHKRTERGRKKGAAEDAPILGKKEFGRLQNVKEGEVIMIGYKGACSSVWCSECYKRKGGSKRFAKRLKELDYKATRQVVLTVDPKKFDYSGQRAFETLRDKKAIAQFIHNLKRTAKIKIVDWTWNLEWHDHDGEGFPHWHLFVQTKKGKQGRIGNKALLNHWGYGLVFESFIKNKKHWDRFVDYFGTNGYFNPKFNREGKDKSHQLELPLWAKKVSYKIRKTGSMAKKREGKEEKLYLECMNSQRVRDLEKDDDLDEKPKEKTYEEILESCGQSTICKVRRFNGPLMFKKISIPFRCFREFAGQYIRGIGYYVVMKWHDYKLFKALYDFEYIEKSNELITN